MKIPIYWYRFGGGGGGINILGTLEEFLHSFKILYCKNMGPMDTNFTACR
jgi:hypothetical protein